MPGQFIVLCRQLNLFSEAVVAVDGAKVQKRMEHIEASITRYLSALDTADEEDAATAPGKQGKLKEKIAALKHRMEQLKEIDALVYCRTNRFR